MSTTNVDTEENPEGAETAAEPDALATAQAEAAKWKDATLRAQADLDN